MGYWKDIAIKREDTMGIDEFHEILEDNIRQLEMRLEDLFERKAQLFGMYLTGKVDDGYRIIREELAWIEPRYICNSRDMETAISYTVRELEVLQEKKRHYYPAGMGDLCCA